MEVKILPMFNLQLNISELEDLSLKYDYTDKAREEEIMNVIAPKVTQTRFLEQDDFLEVCAWKTKRSKSRCAKNSKEYIKEITSIALNTKEERVRIESLTLLDGVGWPTASVFLHFFHSEPYPILDIRALNTLGVDSKKVRYNFTFWDSYVQECRRLAKEAELDMRTLDRALWSYRS
jgi:thermostable 8-oxoguanine DNA glycosylase